MANTNIKAPVDLHCVKNIRIRSYSGLYFPAFGLSVKLRLVKRVGTHMFI